MWLAEVVTLAMGTLVTLIIIHFTVFYVSKAMTPQPPQVIQMQPPQAPAAPPPTFTQPTNFQQTANVPSLEPQNALPPPIKTREDRGPTADHSDIRNTGMDFPPPR